MAVVTKELLSVMNHVRRKGTIVDASKAQYILDNSFGIDQVDRHSCREDL